MLYKTKTHQKIEKFFKKKAKKLFFCALKNNNQRFS